MSDVLSSRSTWWRVGIVALALLCVAEVGVRARTSVLIKPQLWSSPEEAYKEHQIKALAARGGASVIAVGSSTVDAAFDANKVTLASRRPAYNAGTGGASIGIIGGWSELLAVPLLKPDTVIVGIVSRELNPNDTKQQGYQRSWDASRAVHHLDGTESVMEIAEQRLENWSALFRYRTTLRQPRYVERLVGAGSAPTDASYGLVVNNAGQYTSFLPVTYRDTPAVDQQFLSAGLFKWTIGDAQRQTLTRLVSYLTAHVRHVLVVSMPITEHYVSLHPHGQADIDTFNAVMQSTAEAHHATFLNSGVWSTDLFADPGHVNAAGSAQFMSVINAELQRLGWT